MRLFFVVFPLATYAQQGEIFGMVTDKDMNDEPLPFATIAVKGSSKGTTSDIEGNYRLNLDEGSYTLVFSFVGYDNVEISNIKVESGKQTQLNTSLGAGSLTLEEVVIESTANRSSEKILLFQQRNAVVAKQSIGTQELSRKGVSDAEGAVTKVSGISKQDGVKSVFVRGLGDRYNLTTLNGFPIPSEDPEYKNISLDFFSTDIIESVGVDKVFSSGTSSDVAGATINIVSKAFLKDAFEIDLSAGINSQTFGVKNFLKQDGVNFLGFSNKKQPETDITRYSFSNSLDPHQQDFLYNNSIGFSGGKRFKIGNNPLMLFGVLTHGNNFSYTDELIRNTTTDGTVFLDQRGKKYTQNTNQLGLFNASYLMNNRHRLTYNFMFVHANRQYVGIYEGINTERYQDAYNDTYLGYLIRQQNNDNLLIINQLNSNWTLSEKADFEFGVAHNKLQGSEPDRRVNNFSKLSETGDYKLTGSTGRQQRYFITLDENDWNVKMAYSHKLKDSFSKWTFGYNGRFVTDDFQAVEYDLQSQQLLNINNYKLDNLYNQQKLDNGDFQLDRNFDSYQVNKFFHSLYTDLTYRITDNTVLNFGLKGENVDLKVDYNVNRGGTKGSSKINKFYFLPNVNLKYDLNEKNIVRLGASKTYTLPQSKEISPYIYVDVNFKSQGNQDLKPSDNYNLDLKWDYYISPSELVSLTTFYKYIANPIARVEEGGSGGYLTYRNISKHATIAGLEMELRKNIFEKHTETADKRLSLGWNASVIFTELEVNVMNTQKRKSKLEGAAPFITNFDVSYHTRKNGKNHTTSLVFNYFNDRIYTIGTLQYKDIIEKGIPTLDLVSSVDITQKLTLKLKAKNIFNAERELSRETTNNQEKIVLNQFKKGIDFSIGLGYKF